MGTAASSSPEIGVALNPRVEYASKIAQSEGKVHLIDAPVLVNLPAGTIRYRYVDRQQPAVADSTLSLHEGPHRGRKDLEYKKGYFYHTRLADYSTEANKTNCEPEYKFKYVFKGPNAAKNKKLYYVTGKGMHASDHMASYPSGLSTPTWADTRREVNHVYYNLEPQMNDDVSVEDIIDEEINSNASIVLTVNSKESIDAVKEKVSMRILKPTTQIHIYYNQHEIRADADISDLINSSQSTTKTQFKAKLVKMLS